MHESTPGKSFKYDLCIISLSPARKHDIGFLLSSFPRPPSSETALKRGRNPNPAFHLCQVIPSPALGSRLHCHHFLHLRSGWHAGEKHLSLIQLLIFLSVQVFGKIQPREGSVIHRHNNFQTFPQVAATILGKAMILVFRRCCSSFARQPGKAGKRSCLPVLPHRSFTASSYQT